MVEVYAPAYDQSYDMRVEEQTSIRQLMEEMAVLIGQKKRTSWQEIESSACAVLSRGEMLSRNNACKTGIGNGYRLVII